MGKGEKSPRRTMFALTLRSRIIPSDQRPRRLALLASLVAHQNIVLTIGTSPVANISWMDRDRSNRGHLLHCWHLETFRLLRGTRTGHNVCLHCWPLGTFRLLRRTRTGHNVSRLWVSLPSAKLNGKGHWGPNRQIADLVLVEEHVSVILSEGLRALDEAISLPLIVALDATMMSLVPCP